MTANFSHPNIVGLYDLILETENLYLVQEYVEGDNFNALLQTQLNAYEVTDMGSQLCLALMYAGSSSRRVCHGDLVPAALMRDRNGLVRINNFALPTDMTYFTSWSIMGAEGAPLLETDLPWGQQSDERRADDTRAVGLLLYQLLAGKLVGASVVDPPPDGRLRFTRNTPPELCELVARAVVRQHPQHISTPDVLYTQMKALAEALEPSTPSPFVTAPGRVYPAPATEPVVMQQYSPASSGKLVTALPARDVSTPGSGLSAYSAQSPTPDLANVAPTVADMPVKLAAARMAAYSEITPEKRRSSPALLIFLIGLVAFALFFIMGYFLGQFLIK
jgi:serine/threonine protein kinase